MVTGDDAINAVSELNPIPKMTPAEALRAEATRLNVLLASDDFASAMDAADSLAHLRNEFCIPRRRHHGKAPKHDEQPVASPSPATSRDDSGSANGTPVPEELVYLCGNSLGLLPKESRRLVEQEFDVWADRSADFSWLRLL